MYQLGYILASQIQARHEFLVATIGVTEEETALVAGVTGYAITEGEVTDGNVAFPAVQSVLGWGLLMDPNSKFN